MHKLFEEAEAHNVCYRVQGAPVGKFIAHYSAIIPGAALSVDEESKFIEIWG